VRECNTAILKYVGRLAGGLVGRWRGGKRLYIQMDRWMWDALIVGQTDRQTDRQTDS
jgi:hypothetical protein